MISTYIDEDPKACYILTKLNENNDIDLFKEAAQEYTDLDKVDYFIDGDPDTIPKLPLSFSRCRTIEDGIEYYTRKHPELCDDIIAMISRSQFGNLPFKNARQRRIREDDKLIIEQKPVKLSFD
jgi:hypothetical protein